MPSFPRKRITKPFAIVFVLAVYLFSQNYALAVTTGEVYPSLGTSVSESPWSDNAWNTPTNIYTDNSATANVTASSYDSPRRTYVLKATGFNFSAIPDGSTINGVTARINAFYRSGQGSGSMDLCQLLDASRAKVGTNQCSTAVPLTTNTATIITKGGSADAWGDALTTAWIKDPDFGIAIGIIATAQNADVDVDYVTLEVNYTAPIIPTVATPTATAITTTGATLGANVTSLGVPASISERGTCWGTSSLPTTNCLADGGVTTGIFTHARTGMSPNTFYYYRGYATNVTGIGYSADGTFTTLAAPSGTVSASPTTCIISSGGSTCTIPFTWNITNATSPNLFNSTTATQYSTSTSGSGLPYPITNGSNTVQVRDVSTVLASTTVTGSCISGTTWSSGVCAGITYTITATAGANGTTTPSGITTVAQGGSQTYSITPDSGYYVATLLIDGGSVATSTTYTFSNVQANRTISATFALLPTPPINYTIVATSGANGAVTPTGTTTVAQYGSQAYAITPDSGYYVATLLIDGGSVATSTSYTFTGVQANRTISATFAQIPTPPGSYNIVANQNPNGTVTPSGSTPVPNGGSQMYTITPDSGYDVGSIIIDSSPLSSTSTTYTFTTVTVAHTIEATFVALPAAEVTATPGRRLASILFSGRAFPGGIISIVRKELGNEIVSSQKGTTDGNGFFDIRFTDLPTGAHSFGLLIKDPEGRTSQTKFFLVDVNRGDEVYKNIVAPPTIDILNGQVSRGGNVKVFGYASPGHTVRVYFNDILNKEALAGRGGVYSFELPTGALDFGQYKVRTKQINLDGGIESDFSTTRTFIVSKLAVVKADLSGDGKVDIQDWSIFLARWGAKSSLGRTAIDLNSDGKVDIADFSIFIKTIRKK